MVGLTVNRLDGDGSVFAHAVLLCGVNEVPNILKHRVVRQIGTLTAVTSTCPNRLIDSATALDLACDGEDYDII